MDNSGQARFILQINIEQWRQISKENVVPRRVGGIIKLISCYQLSLWSKFATMKSLPSCRLKHRPSVSTLSKENRSKRYLYKLYTVVNLHYPLCRCNQAVSWFALLFVACTNILTSSQVFQFNGFIQEELKLAHTAALQRNRWLSSN